MKRTTLCYIEMSGKLLMLFRSKKENDENAGKYIGLGGHFEEGETPEECMLREIREEAGVIPDRYEYRGIVRFSSDEFEEEEMHLFTACASPAPLIECDEGVLRLVEKKDLPTLPMWEGDRIFLRLLFEGEPFFRLSLRYEGQRLVYAELNGKEIIQR